MSFLKLHSPEESKLLIKDSLKGFPSYRYGCLQELPSMFLNHNPSIDLIFVNQVDIHINKLKMDIHKWILIFMFIFQKEITI